MMRRFHFVVVLVLLVVLWTLGIYEFSRGPSGDVVGGFAFVLAGAITGAVVGVERYKLHRAAD